MRKDVVKNRRTILRAKEDVAMGTENEAWSPGATAYVSALEHKLADAEKTIADMRDAKEEKVETEYVVKQGSAYVHCFAHEGVPSRAVAEWDSKQHHAFRWTDRNGAAMVARDVRGRVVRLRPKAAP